MKQCPDCKRLMPLGEFGKDRTRAKGISAYCSDCNKKYHKEYNRKLRRKVIEAYGGKNPSCQCCKESIYEFLVIDHVNGGGNKQRKTLKLGGTGTYQWIIRNNYPSGFRVLCASCNHAYGAYGYCPHASSPIVPCLL